MGISSLFWGDFFEVSLFNEESMAHFSFNCVAANFSPEIQFHGVVVSPLILIRHEE